jgi:hypothetical protein
VLPELESTPLVEPLEESIEPLVLSLDVPVPVP